MKSERKVEGTYVIIVALFRVRKLFFPLGHQLFALESFVMQAICPTMSHKALSAFLGLSVLVVVHEQAWVRTEPPNQFSMLDK